MRLLLAVLLFSSFASSEEKVLVLKLKNVEIKPLEPTKIEDKPEEVTVGIEFVWQL